jgi:hypothetical protein
VLVRAEDLVLLRCWRAQIRQLVKGATLGQPCAPAVSQFWGHALLGDGQGLHTATGAEAQTEGGGLLLEGGGECGPYGAS